MRKIKIEINKNIKEYVVSLFYVIGYISTIGFSVLLINIIKLILNKYSLLTLDVTKCIISFIITLLLGFIGQWVITKTFNLRRFFFRCARGFILLFILLIVYLILFSSNKISNIKGLDLIVILATITKSFDYLSKNIKAQGNNKNPMNFDRIYGLVYAIIFGSLSIIILIINSANISNGNISNYLYMDEIKLYLMIPWLVDNIKSLLSTLITDN